MNPTLLSLFLVVLAAAYVDCQYSDEELCGVIFPRRCQRHEHCSGHGASRTCVPKMWRGMPCSDRHICADGLECKTVQHAFGHMRRCEEAFATSTSGLDITTPSILDSTVVSTATTQT
ncbi:uncharacterized protein LOC129972900 [Argiope bruennichi]|nr:uncharacterized protein LOC129972900 [Argiope bruennichi]